MSDWIEDEGKRFSSDLAEKKRRENLVAYSNYWASLLRQLEMDAEDISSSAHWAPHLLGKPLKVERIPNGVVVIKGTLPALLTYVTNEIADAVSIKADTYKQTGKVHSTKREKLDVIVEGENVCLSNKEGVYVIPGRGVAVHSFIPVRLFAGVHFVTDSIPHTHLHHYRLPPSHT